MMWDGAAYSRSAVFGLRGLRTSRFRPHTGNSKWNAFDYGSPSLGGCGLRLIGAGSINRGDFPTHRPQIRRELTAMMDSMRRGKA